MTCCSCQGLEAFFDERTAAKELKHYHKKGPDKTTRLLIEALKTEGIDGMTLLDIGGGVGAIQHELLKVGVRTATGVDASTAYLEAAQEEARRQGHADRVCSHHGDFVDVAADVAPADIVTLDKVICCYPDMQALVRLSLSKAGRYYGVVYPRDSWWLKRGAALINLVLPLLRNGFRVYVHPTREIDEIIRNNGLEPRYDCRTAQWQVGLYARPAES